MKMRKIIAIVAAVLMLCSILPFTAMAAAVTGTFEKYSGPITEGDYIVVYNNYALTAAISSSRFTNTTVTISNNAITNPDASIVWHIAPSDSYWNMYNASTNKYAASTGAKNKGQLLASGTDNKSLWTVTGDGTYEFVNKANKAANVNSNLRNNGTYGFACYATATGGALTLYKLKTDEPESDCEHKNAQYEHNCQPTICPDCEETLPALDKHSYEEDVTLAPTCTEAGEKTLTCACGDVKTETVNALGHTYVDGKCSVCGEAQPLEVTINTFANTGVLDGSTSISWKVDGFQFITYKSGSTNAIRTSDSDHFRVYAKNKVEVSSQNGQLLKKVQFNATTTEYANVLSEQTAEGWTASVDGTVVTFTSVNGAESLIINSVSAQVRINSVIVTPYVANCEHDYVGVETQAPTCTVEGVMTYTCSKCEESYTEAIAVIPHSYVEDIIDSTCTTTGTKTYECSVCFNSYDEVIPVKNHNYVDDVCADCGAVKAYKGTLVFDADKENRTEYSSQIQVWESEGLTFTNNKGASTTNVGDYGAPVRIYKNSEIVIEFPEMKTLIIDANVEKKDDYAWTDTLNNAGLSFTEANGIYTITFAEAVDSIKLTCANQVRANSITAKVLCGHAYDNEFDADCNKCGDIREVDAPIAFNGNSISEDVDGLAFRFTVDAKIAIADNRITEIDYAQSSFGEYKLNNMGATMSNGTQTIDIPAVYAWNYTDSSVSYAVRILKLDEDFKKECTITAKPYIVIEKDGVEITVYGAIQSASYNDVLNG